MFRSKNDPKFGVKLGVKITSKKGLSCTQKNSCKIAIQLFVVWEQNMLF